MQHAPVSRAEQARREVEAKMRSGMERGSRFLKSIWGIVSQHGTAVKNEVAVPETVRAEEVVREKCSHAGKRLSNLL